MIYDKVNLMIILVAEMEFTLLRCIVSSEVICGYFLCLESNYTAIKEKLLA